MIMIGILIGILAWVLRQCLQALDKLKWTKTKEFAQVCSYAIEFSLFNPYLMWKT